MKKLVAMREKNKIKKKKDEEAAQKKNEAETLSAALASKETQSGDTVGTTITTEDQNMQ